MVVVTESDHEHEVGRRGFPSSPTDSIDRHRIDHLYRASEGRLLRVLAPSGYGKTTLVARWVAEDRRCVRWVDVSRSDDDPMVLFETLRRALAGIFALTPPSLDHAAAADAYLDALDDGLSRHHPTMPFVLVLDDVHRIRSADGNRLIRSVVEHLPTDSTVVLVGRGHHDHGTVSRLRVSPGVVDASVDDLALDPSETYQFLDRMGLGAGRSDLVGLLAQFEGWPAGLRLVGEVLRAGVSPQQIAGHVHLSDYLSEEWLGQLDDDDRSFLREAACLERFTGVECDAVLGRTGSDRIVRRLSRDELVVFPLDRNNEHYRLHGLLRRWLSDELERSDPQRWTEIHANAARYRELHGDIDAAVQHAIAAADLGLLERLVTEHGGRYITSGRGATVEKWLDAFPPEFIRTAPGPVGLRCIEALHRGDEMRAVEWLRLLDRSEARDRPMADPTRAWTSVLHAALDDRPAAELIPAVAAARDHLDGGPWGSFASWVHGALAFMVGDLTTAREALRAGEFEADLAGTPLLVGHCAATLSIIDACEGDEVGAAASALRAQEATELCGGELLPPSALTSAAVALQHARRSDRDAAARGIVTARRSLSGYRSIAPWLNVIARLSLIRAATLLDDRATARELLQELEYHARHEPSWSEPRPDGAFACAQRLGAQVNAMHIPATGSSALTDAEIRVLELLPTNLSLSGIATQLFLSRNTVKSHAASIYRKLGVTRRADAVDRARAAGLVEAATRR